MATIQMELAPDLFSAIRKSPEEFAREMRLAAAIHWYSRGLISREKGARIADVDRTEFLRALSQEKVEIFQSDADDLKPGPSGG